VEVESENEPRILIDGGLEAQFLKSGYIAFIKDESLQAVQFDPDSKRIVGTPQVLTSDQIYFNRQFAFNNHGTLVYLEGTANIANEMNMVWIDLSGNTEKITKESARFGSPRISPDGKQIVTDLIDGDGSLDIALYNPILGTATNFITQDSVITPVWHPDNVTITYFQFNEPRGVYVKPVDLSYSPKLLFKTEEILNLGNWSGDGRYLVFSSSEKNRGNEQAIVGYFDVKDSTVNFLDFISEGEGVEVFYPSLSPDGNWLSYCSDDDVNQDHVYIVPFPGPGQAHRISIDEGHSSVWTREMNTIYFIGQTSLGFNVSRANISRGSQFSSSEPEVLFSGNFVARGSFSGISIHPNENRFLMEQRVGTETEENETGLHLKVVVNWPELMNAN
jgi:Tol biopolymer transport system component